jgi:hypothetical protein
MDDGSSANSITPHNKPQKRVAPWKVLFALAGGWNPEKPGEKPPFWRGFGKFAYTIMAGDLVGKYPSLLPKSKNYPHGGEEVGRFTHLSEMSFLISEKINAALESENSAIESATSGDAKSNNRSWVDTVRSTDGRMTGRHSSSTRKF